MIGIIITERYEGPCLVTKSLVMHAWSGQTRFEFCFYLVISRFCPPACAECFENRMKLASHSLIRFLSELVPQEVATNRMALFLLVPILRLDLNFDLMKLRDKRTYMIHKTRSHVFKDSIDIFYCLNHDIQWGMLSARCNLCMTTWLLQLHLRLHTQYTLKASLNSAKVKQEEYKFLPIWTALRAKTMGLLAIHTRHHSYGAALIFHMCKMYWNAIEARSQQA